MTVVLETLPFCFFRIFSTRDRICTYSSHSLPGPGAGLLHSATQRSCCSNISFVQTHLLVFRREGGFGFWCCCLLLFEGQRYYSHDDKHEKRKLSVLFKEYINPLKPFKCHLVNHDPVPMCEHLAYIYLPLAADHSPQNLLINRKT